MNQIRFGTAGQSQSFRAMGGKSSLDIPQYTAGFGLNAFEYQCGRGVRLGTEKAVQMAHSAEQHNILFSVHAPYYISMSSMDEQKRLGSIEYILQSCRCVKDLGGKRVIFHTGSCGKQSREQALRKAVDTMQRAQEAVDAAGYGDLVLCPETMGKIGQLGTLEEVLALCRLDQRITPCIDFGHLNARQQGALEQGGKAAYREILDRMADALQDNRASTFHVHFSKIEYTSGGEKQHLTFADTVYGPQFEPLLDLVYERGLVPTLICESAGTQAEDARTMMEYYNSL